MLRKLAGLLALWLVLLLLALSTGWNAVWVLVYCAWHPGRRLRVVGKLERRWASSSGGRIG